jgi:hypothetical protein
MVQIISTPLGSSIPQYQFTIQIHSKVQTFDKPSGIQQQRDACTFILK